MGRASRRATENPQDPRSDPAPTQAKGRWSRRSIVLAAAVILAAAGLSVAYKQGLVLAANPPPGLSLTDLHGIGDLQSMFNHDMGKPRLVLIMSPT